MRTDMIDGRDGTHGLGWNGRKAPRRARSDRERGAQLLELMLAMTIISVGALGFLYATQANLKASRDVTTNDLVSASFANAVATLKNAEFLDLYDDYHNTTIASPMSDFTGTETIVGELLDDQGNPAQVLVTFDVDETNLPAEYGPVLDLDGDGAMNTTDVSTDYQLLPARLTLTYRTVAGMQTRQMFLLLGDE